MSATRILNRSELLEAPPAAAAQRRALALDLFEAALAEVEPHACTHRALRDLQAQGAQLDGCTLFAFGKAARGMAEAALAALDVREGVVVGFEEGRLGPLSLLAGDHPVPSTHAPQHGTQVLQLARRLGPSDVALVLISGGGSAMLELPVPDISLADMQHTTRALLRCGAGITEVNAVRSALSQVKGGGLARALSPATVYNVVLSDVIGSPLHAIASGPTVMPAWGDTTPMAVLGRYRLRAQLPPHVVEHLERATRRVHQEDFAHVHNVIAADNETAQRAMARAAAERGLAAQLDEAPLSGEAREQGMPFIERARRSGVARIGGGETTVTLRGDGRGGRNQEWVLGAAEVVGDGLLASLGTDGIDGTSDDAGALLDADALQKARRAGLDPSTLLARNDSNRFFRAAGSTLHTGKTGTNVADVCLWLP